MKRCRDQKNKQHWLSLATLTVGLSLQSPLLFGLDDPDALEPAEPGSSVDGGLEEIVVTAQKREQDRRDVPLAVSVVSAEDLKRWAIRDVQALPESIPFLTVQQSGSVVATTLSIRGLGTSASNAGLEPSVGVFIDDVYQSRAANIIGDLLDVERIEVLRGPQSTLYGKNTSAGVVSIITKAPAREPHYTANLGAGNYGDQQVRLSATGPITEQLFYRVSTGWHERDGFYQNSYDGSELNNRDRWATRGQLLFEPDDALSLRFVGEYDGVDELCCAAPFVIHQPHNAAAIALLGGSAIAIDPDSRRVAVNNQVAYQHDQWRLSFHVEWDLGAVKATSISAYQDFEMDTGIDGDFSDLDLLSDESRRSDRNRVITQEFRLQSNTNHPLQWLGGLYVYHQQFDHRQRASYGGDMRPFIDVSTTALAGGTPLVDPSPVSVLEQQVLGLPANTLIAEGDGVQHASYDLISRSVALYGQTDWRLTERLTVSAGLRYSYEEKKLDARYTIDAPFSALDLSPGGAIASINPAFTALSALQLFPPIEDQQSSRDDDNLSGSVSLTYKLNEWLSLYSSLRRGFKSGGFQVTSFIPDSGIEFDEEIVDAVELGLMAEGREKQWRLNLTAFHQHVDGYQVFVIENNTSVVSNASDVEISGVELEGLARISRQLSVAINASYTESEFVSFDNGPCPAFSAEVQCDLSGRPLPNVPHWALTASVVHVAPVGSFELTSALQYFYKGSRYASPDLDPVTYQGEVNLVNASIRLSDKRAGWNVSLWARNLTDEYYVDQMFDSVVFPGDQHSFPAEPRTYGLAVGLTF
ncbi:TonB-dependent receptor [Porticoccus sp.]